MVKLATASSILAVSSLLVACNPAAASSSEETTAQLFARLRHDHSMLEVFMHDFPKGADLHNHLVGAIYAENTLRWAAQDGLCVDLDHKAIKSEHCAQGRGQMVNAATVEADSRTEDSMVNSLSMRNFHPSADVASGHDQFFGTFPRFAPGMGITHEGAMLAEAVTRAADDHTTYLELMISPDIGALIQRGQKNPLRGEDFAATQASYSPAETQQFLTQARQETDRMEADMHTLLHCGTPQAAPGCGVRVRYLYATLRTLSPSVVFSQISGAYALVRADSRFVGVNIVAPEDNLVAMRDYDLHMRMFQFMSGLDPQVNLSLHAGELAEGLVPPEGLWNHIAQAVRIAGARRIGHGVDMAYEQDASATLAEMARRHVMVEINQTSNDQILGVRGNAHPFQLYRAAGVPVAFSTDDEGVERINLTHEYVRAAETWPLTYHEFKDLSRTGLEYSFLPGSSLWARTAPFRPVAACAHAGMRPERVPAACATFLQQNEKAQAQWILEEKFAAFENSTNKNDLFRKK
ncbi:adenosine deaminase [Komagataeibacter rhaeticus]|uniref:adenosine deaminase family protein n=1 Tax=Komagataeibacter rhaeticus TaxID=215221 RepID=UPI000D81A9A0|nr:adenosine deaminase [Komagataeibacter rhaeticus]MBL7239242.1 adenosine deaminase [Komagataeibacter rhaeticus]PYD52491.1 adenosine deaminase [Komagataeibacter rhaeticus]GBQ12039.1 adenosine deaminase [Komagataeibacter rhaeticus DSM 16663]